MDKLKSALFGTGPFGEVVEQATSDMLLQPDWEKNIQICDQINVKLENAKHAVRAIRRRTNSSSSKTQYLALVLLESCIKNCGARFHGELSSYRDLQGDLVRIAAVQARGQGGHMAQEQARAILLNLHHFARGRRDLQPLAGLMRAAEQRGARFDGVRREDWAAQLGAVGAAVVQDARNYHQEDLDARRRRPQLPAPQLPPPPAGAAPGQPYIVQGPDGQRMLVQPLPPEQQRTPPPPQQRHADPATAAHHPRPARRHPSPEEQAAQIQAELQVVYDQVSLMGEMLGVKEQEGAAPAAVLADEPITALADSLRNAQSRVAHVVASGGGGDNIMQFLELNVALVDALGRYAALSGGVGVPPSVPPPEIPPDAHDHPTTTGEAGGVPERARAPPPRGAAEDDLDADTLAAIRLSQLEADARAAEGGSGPPAPQPPPPPQQQPHQQSELDDLFGGQGAAPGGGDGGSGEPAADDFTDFALSRDRSRSGQQQLGGGEGGGGEMPPPPVSESANVSAAPPMPPPPAPSVAMGTLPPPPPAAAPLPVLPPPPPPQSSISPPAGAGGAGGPPPAAEQRAAEDPTAANPNAPADGGDDEFDSFLDTKLLQQQDTAN